MSLFFNLIESCDPETGQFAFGLPKKTIAELERFCRYELGKLGDGSEPSQDLPLKRISSLAEKIEEAQAGIKFYQEQLQAANRWGLGDLAFFEALLAKEKAELEKLKVRQARARESFAKGKIDVEALKQSSDLVEVAESYGLKLRRRGGEYWCKCPFHKEKTPSFSINREKQVFSCFGCGESGDLISFIQKIENCDFITACEKLGGVKGG